MAGRAVEGGILEGLGRGQTIPMSADEHGNGIEHPDFRVKDHLASGGMGAVLEAEEATTLRPVALKVMHPEAMQSEEAQRRFLLEAQVMARLEHPNIVPMHVLKRDAQGRLFYTMKKVVGRDLQQILTAIRRGDQRAAEDFPLGRLLQIFQKLCDAIGYAHSKGVVHRDLKPANVMVGEFGEVLVMDWGLAKIIGQQEEAPSPAEVAGLDAELSDSQLQNSNLLDIGSGLTMDGALMGTPQYMAPEQAEGRVNEIDGRTDVWALGGILYAILTLHPPVTGKSLQELIGRIRTGEIASPTVFNSSRAAAQVLEVEPDFKLLHCPGRRIPSALAAIVRQAMQVHPGDRYPTAEALREDVEAWQNGYATAAEKAGLFREFGLLLWRHKLVTLGVVALLALAIGFGLKLRRSLAQRENALVELRSSIPLLLADIDDLIAAGKTDLAHERIDQCIKLIPDRASLYLQKGRIYQSALQFEPAIEQFNKALELSPDDAVKKELALTQGLLDPGRSEEERINLLRDHLVSARRFSELGAVNAARDRIAKARSEQLARWRQTMVNQGAPESVASRLDLQNGTRLALTDLKADIRSLDFLKGIPLQVLHLDTTNGLRMDPLKGMPLEELHLNGPAVLDLSPLKDSPLRSFVLFESRVRDFSFLAGKALDRVKIPAHELKSIDFLKDAPLRHVDLRENPELVDFTALTGKPLHELWLGGSGVTNLEFARGMPLKILHLDNCKLSDLSPLKGAPIERLFLNSTRVTDLTPLAGAPLTELWGGGLLTSLNGLQGAPLTSLLVGGRQIVDLSPVRDARIRRLVLEDTSVSDLSPLAGQPLESVNIAGTPVSDLRPLASSRLKYLDCKKTPYLTDLTGLEQCPNLELIVLPRRQLNLDPIRKLPNLKKLSYGHPPDSDWNRVAPVEQYWPIYDKWRRTRVFK